MDFYEREETAGKGCMIIGVVLVAFMASVVLLMACNWFNSLINF